MAKNPETQTSFLQPSQVGVYLYYEVPGDPRKTRDGLRMETLFEHILFAPQLGFGLVEAPRIYYLVGSRCADPSIVSHLERLGNSVVDADILISSCSNHGCCELPEVPEEDQILDARLGSQIRNGYHELGLRAPCQEEEGWMGDVRQQDFHLDLDEDLERSRMCFDSSFVLKDMRTIGPISR